MRFALFPSVIGCFLTVSAPSSAGDFTGFYAGVNAGYAFERHQDGIDPPAATPNASRSAPEIGLPPSALGAVGSLHEKHETARRNPSTAR